MFLFTLLTVTLLTLVTIRTIIVGLVGTGILIVFGDIIVCVLLITLILRALFKKDKES